MYQQESQQLDLGFHLEPSCAGKKRVKSRQSKRRTDSVDTTLNQLSIFSQPQSLEPQFFTLEFPAILKKLTWSDKLSFLSLSTLIVKLSKTLHQDSTSKGRVYKPYWNEFCQAMSEWLSLPTKTDYVGLGSILSHGLQSAPTVRFWFSTTMHLAQSERCLKMFLLSSMCSVADFTDSASTKRTLKKTLTYRVYPLGETKKVWQQRIHAYRKVYNNAIAYLNEHQGFSYTNTKGEIRTSGKKEFRCFCKTLGTSIIPQWCKDLTIAHALDNALFEAYTAWTSTKREGKFIINPSASLRVNGERSRTVNGLDKPNPSAGLKIAKFRSIRNKNQTIQFDPKDYKNGHWMASCGLLKAEFWGQNYCLINYDSATELTYNKGRWFANFPVDVEVEVSNKSHRGIALDPGLRTFVTGFDGKNFMEFAKGDFSKIAKLCYHLDKLKSKHDLSKGKKFNRYRYRLRQAMERIRTRIKNLRDECHKQVASYLARNYDVIYLPTFETSQMVVKSKRKLSSKSARSMMTWAFYKFSQTLGHLCNRYGSRLVRVTEEFTSKTCTSCGHVHYKLGGSKIFKCPNCGYEIPRDFQGALGILLKALWDTTSISTVSANDVMFELSNDVQ